MLRYCTIEDVKNGLPLGTILETGDGRIVENVYITKENNISCHGKNFNGTPFAFCVSGNGRQWNEGISGPEDLFINIPC